MGTTRLSSSIYSVFKTLIYQFQRILRIKDIIDIESTIEAKNCLFNTILSDYNIKNKRILILLDAIDQLNEIDRDLKWLPHTLPRNVKLIITTHESIHERIKKLISQNSYYLNIDNITLDAAELQLRKLLRQDHRILQPHQWDAISNCLRGASKIYPLHVSLLFKISINWRPRYMPSNEFKDCTSIQNTIKYLFSEYEEKFGQTLFAKLAFYLTIMNGITESELRAVMSKNEDDDNASIDSIIKNMSDLLIFKRNDETILINW